MPTIITDLKEKKKVLSDLLKREAFKSFHEKTFEEFVLNAEHKITEPGQTLWQKETEKPKFSILIEGAVGISNNERNGDSLDAFSNPYELIGEFERFGARSEAARLYTLNTVKILTPTNSDLNKLIKKNPEVFIAGLSRNFVAKIQHKDALISILSNFNQKDRFRTFLGKFCSTWKRLKKDLSPTDKSYLIDIYWKHQNLESILSLDYQSLRKVLKAYIEEEIIKVNLYDEDLNQVDGDFKKSDDSSREKMVLTSADVMKLRKDKKWFMVITVIAYNKVT